MCEQMAAQLIAVLFSERFVLSFFTMQHTAHTRSKRTQTKRKNKSRGDYNVAIERVNMIDFFFRTSVMRSTASTLLRAVTAGLKSTKADRISTEWTQKKESWLMTVAPYNSPLIFSIDALQKPKERGVFSCSFSLHLFL